MEEQRPPKRRRLMVPNQDTVKYGSPREQEDPEAAGGEEREPGPRAKPLALVKPFRRAPAAPAEPAPAAERSRSGGGSRRASRGRAEARGHPEARGRRRAGGRTERRQLTVPDLRVEVRREEVGPRAERETRPIPSVPLTEEATTPGDPLQDHDPYPTQTWRVFQVQPYASGYWSQLESPASAFYRWVGLRPPAGYALPVMQTSHGTYVYGVPGFFVYTAR